MLLELNNILWDTNKTCTILPEVAVRIAFVITSDRDSGSCTSALYFVDDLKEKRYLLLDAVVINRYV